jgi:hypothetical protein
MKASNRKTGAPVELAFDETGRAVERQSIFQRVLKNRVRKFGKLHETLYARLQETDSIARIPVAVWLRSEKALEIGEKKALTPRVSPRSNNSSRPARLESWVTYSSISGNGTGQYAVDTLELAGGSPAPGAGSAPG